MCIYSGATINKNIQIDNLVRREHLLLSDIFRVDRFVGVTSGVVLVDQQSWMT